MSSARFREMIANARTVEVCASDLCPPHSFYAMDHDAGWLLPPDQRGKVTVLCSPRHVEIANALVRTIRE